MSLSNSLECISEKIRLALCQKFHNPLKLGLRWTQLTQKRRNETVLWCCVEYFTDSSCNAGATLQLRAMLTLFVYDQTTSNLDLDGNLVLITRLASHQCFVNTRQLAVCYLIHLSGVRTTTQLRRISIQKHTGLFASGRDAKRTNQGREHQRDLVSRQRV